MTATVSGIHLSGTHAARPAAAGPPAGSLYSCTTHTKLYRTDGTSWSDYLDASGVGGGAVATDTIWDAAGDLAVGTGADTAARLAVGAAGTVPRSNGTTLVSAYPTAGRVHYAVPHGYDISADVSSGNLGINGGTYAEPIIIPSLMVLDTLRYRNGDTATARSIEFGLFRDDGAAGAVCVAKGTDSFTPTVASLRTPQFTSAPITIPPGAYWFVVRNTGGATNFLISFRLAGTTNIGLVQMQTQTLAGALPAVDATLDMTTGWTRTNVNSLAFALIGRVFGEASAF